MHECHAFILQTKQIKTQIFAVAVKNVKLLNLSVALQVFNICVRE